MAQRFNLIFKIVFVLVMMCWSCQTKPFKKIQIKGHIFDAKTKQPILGSLMIKTDEVHATQGDPGVVLISGKSQIDGSFILKCNASKRKDALYYLFYKNDTIPQYLNLDVYTGKVTTTNNSFTASEQKTTDLGDIYINF